MSQGIFSTIVPTTTSGNQLATILNDFKEAVVSGFSGSSRPSELDPGGYWVDTSNANLWLYKVYTGVSDITIFSVNLTTGLPSITGADSNFEIIKISADTIGPALRLVKERIATNGQTLTGDTLGEIQFYSTRDSGTNVVSATIKAIATDDTTSTAQGTYLSFLTSNDASAAMTEAMRLVDGKLGIGITTPEEILHVEGNIKAEREVDDALATKVKVRKKRVSGSGQVLNNDSVGSVEFLSTDDAGTEIESVLIEASARENQTSSAHGSSLTIKNKKLGETAYTTQVTIAEAVTVGTNLIVTGDLTVNGTSTTLNTQTLDVEDANIMINKGGTQATANTNKAGITVEMTDAADARIGYDSTKNSKFVIGDIGSESEIISGSAIQSLTNKTFNADLNTLSNVDDGNIKVGANITRNKLAAGTANRLVVNDASGIISEASAITGSRALVSNANGIPTHSATTATELGYLSGVTSAIQTQLNGKTDEVGGSLTNGSIITPTRSDVKQAVYATLVSYATTASNGQLVFATDQKKMYQVVDGNLTEIGGAGVGGINYVENYSFENDANGALPSGWARYVDVAGEAPVDGTGGSPNTDLQATTTTPLRGSVSANIIKNAGASRQGEGASYDFTIDSADQAQVLRISFDYNTEVSTTNYVDGDIRVYVYDVTNSRIIEVIDRDLYASAQGKFVGTFQTSPDSLSYRLIFHIAGTGTTAWTVELDNVIVGPQTIVKGAIVTDWQAYTPVISGFGTPTGISFYWRRVGANLEAYGTFTSGTSTATAATFTLPNGLVSSVTTLPTQIAGRWHRGTSGATTVKAGTIAIGNGDNVVSMGIDDYTTASSPFTAANGSSIVSSGGTIRFSLSIPIQGWSSNVVLSEDAGNREIVASAYLGTAANHTSSGSALLVPLDFELFDTTSSFDSVTSKLFTVPESGYYDISGAVSFNSILTGFTQSEVFINGVPQIRGSRVHGNPTVGAIRSIVNGILLLNKGDTVGLYATQNESALEAYITGKENTYLHIAKRSSPQTIAASEVVAASYKSDSVANIVSTGSGNILKFEDLFFDTHNAYNTSTGYYTIPVSGKYSISAYFQTASFTPTAETNAVTISIAKEIAGIDTFIFSHAQRIGSLTATSGLSGTITGIVDLVKGDKISIWGACSVATTLSSTNSRLSTFSINKINGVS